MKLKAFASVLFIFMSMSMPALGQETTEKIRFHFAPLNLFDPMTGVLQVGVQKNISQRFALSLDHGFRMQKVQHLIFEHDYDRLDYRYSKTKAELKYFFSDPTGVGTFYLSTEGMYFPQQYRKENSHLIRNDTHYRYTSSNIDRTVWTASLKFGVELKVNRFVFDHFFGLGARRIAIAHQAIGLQEFDYYEETDVWFPPLDRKEGVFYRPHVSAGMKVGYMIK